MIKAISFDMACTLYWEPGCSEGWYGSTLKRAIDRVYDYLVGRGYIVDYDRIYGLYKECSILRQNSEEELWHLYRWYYVLSRAGLNPYPRLVYSVYKEFVKGIVECFSIPYSHRKLLEDIKRMGYTVILSTDTGSHEIALGVLEKTRTIDYFDYVISSQLVGYTKRSQYFYERLLEITGLKPYEVVHVGDNLERDYVTPSSIGIKAVLYNPSNSSVRDNILSISRLDKILDLINNLKEQVL